MGSVAIVALVVGLASGCSGAQGASGPDASPSHSARTSATPTSSSTPSATLDDEARARIPTAARAHTAKGAEAFARFYLEQVNKSWMAPDPELIRPYALESCKTCANYVDTAEAMSRDGRRYESAPSLIGPSVVMPESEGSHVLIHVGQVQMLARILREDGTVAKTMRRVPGEVEIDLRDTGLGWRIAEIRGVVG